MQIDRRHRQIEVMGQLVAPAAADQPMQHIALAGREPYSFLRGMEKVLHPAVDIGRRDDQDPAPAVRSRQEVQPQPRDEAPVGRAYLGQIHSADLAFASERGRA